MPLELIDIIRSNLIGEEVEKGHKVTGVLCIETAESSREGVCWSDGAVICKENSLLERGVHTHFLRGVSILTS